MNRSGASRKARVRRTVSRSSYAHGAIPWSSSSSDPGAGACEQDRRVSRDDELRARASRTNGDCQQSERSADGEGGLGLVEDVQPIAAEPVCGQREEGLAVRLLVQRHLAVERPIGAKVEPPSTKAAMLKKLSARRKYPFRGFVDERTGVNAPSKTGRGTAGSSPSRSSSPPSSAKPIALAIASTSVDFPLPLSPARSVIGVSRSSSSSAATTGTSKGNPSPQRAASRRRPTMYGPRPNWRTSRRRATIPP